MDMNAVYVLPLSSLLLYSTQAYLTDTFLFSDSPLQKTPTTSIHNRRPIPPQNSSVKRVLMEDFPNRISERWLNLAYVKPPNQM